MEGGTDFTAFAKRSTDALLVVFQCLRDDTGWIPHNEASFQPCSLRRAAKFCVFVLISIQTNRRGQHSEKAGVFRTFALSALDTRHLESGIGRAQRRESKVR